MAAKIPVGVNIIASEQVTKVFDKVRAAIQKVLGSANQAPKAATAALQESSKAVKAADATIPPKLKKKGNDIEVDGAGFGAFQKPAKMYASGVENMGAAIRNFMLLLVGSGGITYGIKRFSDNVSDSIVDMNRLGNRVGLPTKAIREMGFVARAAGVPVSTLGQALTSLSDAQFDKKFGMPSESVKALSALNSRVSNPISLINPDGSRANLKKVFFDIVRGLGEINDPSLKAKVASSLLGGEESLKFGDMGQKRLQSLQNHFQVSPFSKELIDQAYNYNTAVADIDASLDRLKFTAGSDILRGFSQGLEKSAGLISQNSTNVQKLAFDLAEKLPKAIPAMFSGLEKMSTAFAWLDEKVGMVNVTLGVLGSYTLARTIIMIGDLTKAITILRNSALITTAIAAAPALGTGALVAGAVGAAGYGIYKLKTAIEEADDQSGTITHGLVQAGVLVKKQSEAKSSNESLVRIVFENSPAGMRVVEKNSSSASLAVELGLNLGGAF